MTPEQAYNNESIRYESELTPAEFYGQSFDRADLQTLIANHQHIIDMHQKEIDALKAWRQAEEDAAYSQQLFCNTADGRSLSFT